MSRRKLHYRRLLGSPAIKCSFEGGSTASQCGGDSGKALATLPARAIVGPKSVVPCTLSATPHRRQLVASWLTASPAQRRSR